MPRAPALIAFSVLAALAGCNKPKTQAAAPSGSPAASGAPAAAAPASSAAAAPTHNWVYQNGPEYQYISGAHGEAGVDSTPTTVRYLGEKNGAFFIAEVEGGAVVVASCAPPCDQVRLQGKDLDQTLPLNRNSIVAAALEDAMNGQLQVYPAPEKPQG